MGQPTILLIKEIYYPILAVVGVPANLMTIVTLTRGNCGLSKCISIYMVAMATGDLLVMIINVMMYHIFSYHFPHSFLSHTPVSNLMTIVTLLRGNCGLSKCISIYMVAMATGDLLVMIINGMVYHIFSYHFPHSFLPHTPVCKFILYLTAVSLDLSVWFIVSFTFDRFIIICCQTFKTKYCTERTAALVITIFSILIFIKNIPAFFAYESEQIINKLWWGCQANLAFFSSPFSVGYSLFHSIWRVWIPFTLIVLFNSLTVRCVLVASRARRRLRGHSSENQSDSELENRRKSIILLFTISGSFILLWLTDNVSFVTTRLINTTYYRGDRTAPAYIATETGVMMKLLNSCINTFIYAATQRKFREELKKALICPWTLIEGLLKNKAKPI
ncbi:allatostatin-A receptor-like [Scyliorhinus canicula]|uniref:allatostatin-A receptor-like n=1 Tax=Scyliorhinus canicula TaxID=7830 RepID=UPI0018F2CF34|nr:allatostatin-A receptor-like [Scyliorhinus canicula]